MVTKLARHSTFFIVFACVFLGDTRVWAHCDGLDGPVVTAARESLKSANVSGVLIWVRKENEAEIRSAFNKTMAVRKLGAEAQALADQFFFETLVRIHRAGEGAPFTGLKGAGRDLGPAIPAADKAITNGSDAALARLLTDEVRRGLHRHFHAVIDKKDFSPNDVTAGRAFVEAYVPFIHYVERLYDSATRTTDGHSESH